MDASFGAALRSVRVAHGLSLAKLARRIPYSASFVGHVETGLRQPTPEFARCVDEALQASGLFVELARIGAADTVYRRTLIRALGTLSGVGVVAPAAVAESVRRSLDTAAGLQPDCDWDGIVADYGRGFMTEPLRRLAQRAVGDLMVVSTAPEAHGRHGVRIAMVYGSSVASLGDSAAARRWYGTAVALADHTGDADLRAWSRARLAYRIFYEGGTDDEVLKATELAIARAKPSPALVEAHAARAHVHAHRADKKATKQALGRAYAALDAAGGQDDVSIFSMPSWRLAIAASWAHTALGEIEQAEAAQAEARHLPEAAKRWHAQVKMHRAWGKVQRDSIDTGAEEALHLLTAEPSTVIRGLAQRVHAAVPERERARPAVRELAHAITRR
ncbi:helix-turn-helix domain-containing protein [Kribbella sp. CA-293567]|uniref:helix-turn-helix domain-containing protein n=1 Tax=Kribbella sp. CA-293567 TaxID=3002436 RepID=UPI0022DE704B|nr:helix-turn-helix transcriptional regulator [Kribbella sp. CA-293567]WBQ03834.1 helix-turn-helix transcriptional regulator [Kribbella sp. CA-293567]